MDHITTGDELEEAAEIKSIYDSHMAALAALDGKKKIHCDTIPFSPEQEKLLRTLIESRAADCKEYLRSRGITV